MPRLKTPELRAERTEVQKHRSQSSHPTTVQSPTHHHVERTSLLCGEDSQGHLSGLAVSSPKSYDHQHPRIRNSVKLFSTVYTGQYFNRPNISIFQYFNRPNISTFHLSCVSSIKIVIKIFWYFWFVCVRVVNVCYRLRQISFWCALDQHFGAYQDS